METEKLAISQIFGPTLQGEGSAAGQHCVFVRTFNCNLECSWCDTAYTWAVTPEKAAAHQSGNVYDKNDPHLGLKYMTVPEVLEELMKLWNVRDNPTNVIISGGEPMMQQGALVALAEDLAYQYGNDVHIETAGTIPPLRLLDEYVYQYNVSPKLSSSGNRAKKAYKPQTLAAFQNTGKAWFKFVVTGNWDQDFDEIDFIVGQVGIPRQRVMVMPEGTTAPGTIFSARQIVDEAIRRGYGLTFRSHILLWGDNPDK